jgi:RHS repeat-associated protein
VLKRFAYGYDSAGNRSSEQIDDSITSDTHDSLNRLTGQSVGGALRFVGTVNESATVTIQGKPAVVDATNRFSGTAPVASGTTMVTIAAKDGSGNQSTASYNVGQTGTSRTLTYDANGNLTGDGMRSFTWDAENRLLTVTIGTKTSEFTYDGGDRRVRIVEKDGGATTRDAQLIWDGTEIAEERLSTGEVNRFFTDGEQHNGTARYLTRDHLGSIREVTDSMGAVVTRNEYDPYGRLTRIGGTEDSRFGFTGHYVHGPSGLALAQFRAYDSNLGRWLSEDPIRLMGGSNLYAYVDANPTGRIDPLGEDWRSAVGNFLVGVVGGAAGTVAVSAGIASGTIVGGGVAVAAIGVGAYQATIVVQKVLIGIDPYTGRPLSSEERVDVLAGMIGALVGGGMAGRGAEIEIGDNVRVAPVGNRTGSKTGELPHYHRAVPDPESPGNSLPGQGIRRHRPWDIRSTDKSFCSRF